MKPYYQDLHNTLYCMDFRENDLPDESVQMVVTSPPYWGLRKYSGEQELIWGDNHCEHQWGDDLVRSRTGWEATPEGQKQFKPAESDAYYPKSNFCSLCGAWKGAYGLEPTPEMYIEHTILILREIRRVLRKDGVVFLNLGDSYFGSWADYSGKGRTAISSWNRKAYGDNNPERPPSSYPNPILKPKDLCLIPFRVAIATQEDGWWVRSVIIWSKPNPMPESVTDRPTESHEYILMLTKSSKYYWDADAVREPYSPIERWGGPVMKPSNNHKWADNSLGRERLVQPNKVRGLKTKGPYELSGQEKYHGQDIEYHPLGRNIRTVWEFPTQPYPEAHFAVFPEKLPEICIKAATPEVGCCGKCGSPWERVVERVSKGKSYATGKSESKRGNGLATAFSGYDDGSSCPEFKTLGWQPTCKCNADKVPSIVLDPFMGAGTTLWVAKKLNRKAIGYEISEEYCQLAVERIRQQVML